MYGGVYTPACEDVHPSHIAQSRYFCYSCNPLYPPVGGAMLDFLTKGTLPGIEALNKSGGN